MNIPGWRTRETKTIQALDQTWYFTPDVIRVFRIAGLDPEVVMKGLIMEEGSMKPYDDGVYKVFSFGFEIQLRVASGAVFVGDPYAW
jgi:hypothetical protein